LEKSAQKGNHLQTQHLVSHFQILAVTWRQWKQICLLWGVLC